MDVEMDKEISEDTPQPAKDMTDQEAATEMARLVKCIDDAFNNATAHADKYSLSFSVDSGGYGMGGYYDESWSSSSQNC
jgi:hypothetical protein